MKIDLTNHEAALIYELLHEIKLKCVRGASKEDREQAKRIIEDCNGLMKKVEDIVLAMPSSEDSKKKKKGKKSGK
tara:strand:- start:22 stop:246 length:225 start_codon:yes stop_codon:yes gene_type:complete